MARTLSSRRQILAVLCGGFLGTISRYLLSLWLQGLFGKAWPYDILLINITGALVLSFVTTLADATFLIGPTRRLFINVGFLGAYTTFSSLALGDALLLEKGAVLPALLYLILSLVGGIVMVIVGDWLGQRCITLGRPLPKKAVTSSVPSKQPTVEGEHLDVDDDLLIPDNKH